jgi:hypothetical protein
MQNSFRKTALPFSVVVTLIKDFPWLPEAILAPALDPSTDNVHYLKGSSSRYQKGPFLSLLPILALIFSSQRGPICLPYAKFPTVSLSEFYSLYSLGSPSAWPFTVLICVNLENKWYIFMSHIIYITFQSSSLSFRSLHPIPSLWLLSLLSLLNSLHSHS